MLRRSASGTDQVAEIHPTPSAANEWKPDPKDYPKELWKAHEAKPKPEPMKVPKPAPKVESKPKPETPRERLERIFGGQLQIVKGGERQFEDLARVPERVLRQTAELGVRLEIGDGPITSLPTGKPLKGQRPRGWGVNDTWDDVAGGYAPSVKTVMAGNTGRGGSVSVALHEYGHAVGDVLGFNESARLESAHVRLFEKLSA